MNQIQRQILIRLSSISIVMLSFYLLTLSYIDDYYSDFENLELVFFVSVLFLIFMGLVWVRERNLYNSYIMKRRIGTGNMEYIMCPSCRIVQIKGQTKCLNCGEQWIFCKECWIPFEEGSSVLISPCCGEGFHPDHFESALREKSECPYCGSTLPLIEADW